jgi:hypothetical protein
MIEIYVISDMQDKVGTDVFIGSISMTWKDSRDSDITYGVVRYNSREWRAKKYIQGPDLFFWQIEGIFGE